MLKLVMAISGHGYTSLKEDDRMTWTGADDKAAFRLLTMTGSRVCGVSEKTGRLMPKHLENRRLVRLSSKGTTLYQFWRDNPGATLLGGQTIALEAIGADMLDEVHLCRVETGQLPGAGAQKELIRRNLRVYNWDLTATTRVGSVTVEHWLR